MTTTKQRFRWMRKFWDTNQEEEISEERWVAFATDNTRDFSEAIRSGFSTANAHYWIEPPE